MSYKITPMNSLIKARSIRKISQRNLAERAEVSFRSIQLIEAGGHDPQVSTLEKIAASLGYPPRILEEKIEVLFETPPDSIWMISERIVQEGEKSWKIWLFNFVDAFRRSTKTEYIENPPVEKTPLRIKALLTATTESLCDELELLPPAWCEGMPILAEPWFVSEMEGLKPTALLESPVHFRKRNIFVLGNFLERQ